MARGVKARDTICRSLVWSGASWLMRRKPDCSRSSLVMPGAKRMMTPLAWVEKSVWFFDTAATSACLLSAQKPWWSGKPARASSSWATNDTGAVRRMASISSCGTRSASTSGSVGSKAASGVSAIVTGDSLGGGGRAGWGAGACRLGVSAPGRAEHARWNTF